LKDFDLQYFLENNGVEKLSDNGERLLGCCPFPEHEDNNPSWSIYTSPPYGYICFSCGRKGTLSQLKRELGFIGSTPGEFSPLELEAKREIVDIRSRIKNIGKLDIDIYEKVKLPKGFIALENSEYKSYVYKYLKGRDVLEEIVGKKEYYRCGTCDEFKGYLILPIYENGECVYWTGRSFSNFCSKQYRFINPKKTDCTLGKSNFLYSPYLPSASASGIVVEGQFDVIKLLSFGVNVVGTFNATPSAIQIRRMTLLFNSVTILYDPDEAGKVGTIFLGRKLQDLGVRVYVMKAKRAPDAGEYKNKADFIKDFKERSVF